MLDEILLLMTRNHQKSEVCNSGIAELQNFEFRIHTLLQANAQQDKQTRIFVIAKVFYAILLYVLLLLAISIKGIG
jgi:hypothetical protein